jgi:polyisoprenoid-binding protein YceI
MRSLFGAVRTLAAVLAVSVGSMAAQAHEWTIDKAHSEADFAIRHMAINTVHGSFRGLSGTVRFEAGNPKVWAVDATIDVSSVDTGVAQRDNDLRSDHFFDVAKYPTMTFKSTAVKPDSSSGYLVTGNLTLHGVTRPVTLTLESPGNEQIGMDSRSVHRGFMATTTINRKDFGLNWNGTLKGGDAVVADEVKIELDIEAVEK